MPDGADDIQTSELSVLRNKTDSQLDRVVRGTDDGLFAVDKHLSRSRLRYAEYGFHDLGAAGAHQTGDAKNLSLIHI